MKVKHLGLWLLFSICMLPGKFAAAQTYQTLKKEADELHDKQRYREALQVMEKAMQLAPATLADTASEYISALSQLAVLYYIIGRPHKSDSIYDITISLYRKKGPNHGPDFIEELGDAAYIKMAVGKYNQSKSLYEELLTIKEKKHGRLDTSYARTIHDLGLFYKATGNYAIAEKLYLQAFNIIKEYPSTPAYAESLNDIALLYSITGKTKASEELLLEAVQSTRKVNNGLNLDYGINLANLAGLYETKGDYVKAELSLKEGLAIFEKLSQESNLKYAALLTQLGLLYQQMGNNPEAEKILRKCAGIRLKTLHENHPDYAVSLNNLAQFLVGLNRYSESEALLKKAIAIRFASLGEDRNYFVMRNNLAVIFTKQRKYTEADSLFRLNTGLIKRILSDTNMDYAISLYHYAVLHKVQKRFTVAGALLDTTLSIIEKSSDTKNQLYIDALMERGLICQQTGEYKKAKEMVSQASDIALNSLASNLGNMSQQEKMNWLNRNNLYFDILASIMYDHPDPAYNRKLADQQLQIKASILNDDAKALAIIYKSKNSNAKNLLKKWQINRGLLSKQYSLPGYARMEALDSLEEETNRIEKEISLLSAEFRKAVSEHGIGTNQVQERLQNGEAAIEFIRFNYFHGGGWTDSVLYAALIIVPQDITPHFVVICEERQLSNILLSDSRNPNEELIESLYKFDEKGKQLFSLVWQPVQHHLKSITKLYISPAGLLNRLAFHVIPLNDEQYLLDRYQVKQYNSIRRIAEQQASLASPRLLTGAVLYGGIEYNRTNDSQGSGFAMPGPAGDLRKYTAGNGFGELQESLKEVKSIAQLFTNHHRQASLITGINASEESIKQWSGHSPVLLHIATHGFALPNPATIPVGNTNNEFFVFENAMMRNGIIMAGANQVWMGGLPKKDKEDGILTAYEIASLDLSNTELVVLSACETALGDIQVKEGVLGLQRAFTLAGVQSQLLSLWPVRDIETSQFMKLFYAERLSGLSAFEALSKIRKAMRQKSRPPYYWAAFVLLE